MLDISLFSSKYQVRRLTPEDLPDIYSLCQENPFYFKYCQEELSLETILKDMRDLPPHKTYKDKYYIGFFENENLIAVMDFIDRYPENNCAFIGFFMMNISFQGKGTGSHIIQELCAYLKTSGLHFVRLAWVKGNPQSEHFWLKNHFVPLKETSGSLSVPLILAERFLL